LFSHAALYHFHVELPLTSNDTDNSNNKTSEQPVPAFDDWLLRGEAIKKVIVSNDQSYNSTLASYFDGLSNFGYDSESNTFSWSVPFDWNSSKIKDNGQGFVVLEEIIIPKALFNSSNAAPIVPKVNGLAVPVSSFAPDMYSYEDKAVFYYRLNLYQLVNMSSAISKPTPSEMTFTLSQDNNVHIPEFEGSSLSISLIIAIIGSISVIAFSSTRPRMARFGR
jgi:hypothetical protein